MNDASCICLTPPTEMLAFSYVAICQTVTKFIYSYITILSKDNSVDYHSRYQYCAVRPVDVE